MQVNTCNKSHHQNDTNREIKNFQYPKECVSLGEYKIMKIFHNFVSFLDVPSASGDRTQEILDIVNPS